jgi:hypothetical protein
MVGMVTTDTSTMDTNTRDISTRDTNTRDLRKDLRDLRKASGSFECYST